MENGRMESRESRGRKEPQLDFYNCLRLLEALVENGLLQKDLRDPDRSRILVYRAASEGSPEGWYSDNAHVIAEELAEDAEGQEFLLARLAEKGASFQAEDPWWTGTGEEAQHETV